MMDAAQFVDAALARGLDFAHAQMPVALSTSDTEEGR
jgi:hypothetical protein